MARKSKKRRSFPPPATDAKRPQQRAGKKKARSAPAGQPVRETIESLAVAFVLAFLFRTFQAEAFVIPTGSMAPTLMGQHKDIFCPQSGQRYQLNAASESPENRDTNSIREQLEREGRLYGRPDLTRLAAAPSPTVRRQVETVGGGSPTCRYPQQVRSDLPPNTVRVGGSEKPIEDEPTFSGDRILVNKFIYSFADPQRWDVVVFKYPGNAVRNYIKRLVGLPNEDLLLAGGDVYTRPAGSGGAWGIATKPPKTQLAMRQLVHDTDHDAAALHAAGWPLRWAFDEGAGWSVEERTEGPNLRQVYSAKAGGAASWLRYRHTPAGFNAWRAATGGGEKPDAGQMARLAQPELVTDYNAYNTEIERHDLTVQSPPSGLKELRVPDHKRGLHWVGDLMIEASVTVRSKTGRVLLDLVEAGRHHRCTIDVATGAATLSLIPFGGGPAVEGYAPTAVTSIRGPGSYELRLSNFDNELTLWVNGAVVAFDAPTTYPAPQRVPAPQTSDADAGDLEPAAIGCAGAEIRVTRLQLWRDLYYIASRWDRPDLTEPTRMRVGAVLTDIPQDGNLLVAAPGAGKAPAWELARDPDLWPKWADRRQAEFTTGAGQLFVMGDNSAASSDSRLWVTQGAGSPGGAYLDKSLLIGKAVCVYWPHSWYSLKLGSRRRLTLPVPNFRDMRLVR
ncbi:MAG: S26 family signal peptidase [Planctomycetota bacterium]